jgi:hypothetical protein
MVIITGVAGLGSSVWNGTFGIYNVLASTFNFLLSKETANPQANPTAIRMTFEFDNVMRDVPPHTRIHLGPGIFKTRGFAPNDARGWQPKTGQKIVGAGVNVTILQLVGAENADQHYHAVGMPIEPNGSTPIAPLEQFEISDLSIDCNMDNQPGRPDPGYGNVACGAVRILGNHCQIHNVKAINWGTKSLKQGCFVISIIQASGQPTGEDDHPILTETQHNGIEDCIAIEPSKNNARETTVLQIGGVKNSDNHAQGFGIASFIRKNFVDCQFFTSVGVGHPDPIAFASHFITSKGGTQITVDTGTFVGKHPHFRNELDERSYVRFYNPKDPLSRWNGYFQISLVDSTEEEFSVLLGAAPPNTTADSSFVIMGTEFRAIAVTSGLNAVVEQNQIHNCWIGGPYQSPMDDETEFDPDVPSTRATEERLDPLNALNTRSLIVRDNVYRHVAVGPCWNMGGVSGAVAGNSIAYNPVTGRATVTTAVAHKLWLGARVQIEGAGDARYEGLREIVEVFDSPFSYASYFRYQLAPGLDNMPVGTPTYRIVSGTDFLVIEHNHIQLLDADETEFAIKEYPSASSPAQ